MEGKETENRRRGGDKSGQMGHGQDWMRSEDLSDNRSDVDERRMHSDDERGIARRKEN